MNRIIPVLVLRSLIVMLLVWIRSLLSVRPLVVRDMCVFVALFVKIEVMQQSVNCGERPVLKLFCYVVHWGRKLIFHSANTTLNPVLWTWLLVLSVVRLLSPHRVIGFGRLGFSADLLSRVLWIRFADDRRRGWERFEECFRWTIAATAHLKFFFLNLRFLFGEQFLWHVWN